MIVVVADTSGLLAALEAGHPDGEASREVLRTAGTLVISALLLSELDHVGRRVLGWDATHQAIDDISHWIRAGRAVVPEVSASVLDTAKAVRLRYLGLQLDLADAVNVAFAAEFHTDAILTLDRTDFRAIRPLTDHRTFRVLPDDV